MQEPVFDLNSYTKKARKSSKRDLLKRDAAIQGWKDAKDFFESNGRQNHPDHSSPVERLAYLCGRALASQAFFKFRNWDQDHPFGGVDDPRVPSL